MEATQLSDEEMRTREESEDEEEYACTTLPGEQDVPVKRKKGDERNDAVPAKKKKQNDAIVFTKLSSSALLPVRLTSEDAEFFFLSPKTLKIQPYESIKIKTGIGINVPTSFTGVLSGRPYLATKYNVHLLYMPLPENSHEEVQLVLMNFNSRKIRIPERIVIATMTFFKSSPLLEIAYSTVDADDDC